MKKIIISFLSILIILLSLNFVSYANFNDEDVTAQLKSNNYYMLNTDENFEIFARGEAEHVQPAAMNKLLAGIVAIESWGDLNETITVSESDLSLYPDAVVTNIGIKAGESYTKLQLIQAMIIVSANDAESIIAYQISGSKEAFAEKMNSKAIEIGCNDTNVISIYGFDEEGQYTTAKDVALIFAYGMKNGTFSDIIQLQTLSIPATNDYNEKTYSTRCTPALSSSQYYHASIKGGKETFTNGSGRCIAVYSNQDGYSYVTVVMNGLYETNDSISVNNANNDVKQMITWVYKNLAMKTICDEDSVVATLPVKGGKKTDVVQLSPAESVTILSSKNVSVDSVLVEIEETMKDVVITPPVAVGDVICKADVIYANKVIETIDLVAAESVALSPTRLFLNALGNFFANGFVIFLEVIALIVLIILIIRYAKDIYFKDKDIPLLEKINIILEKIKNNLVSFFEKLKEKKGSIK